MNTMWEVGRTVDRGKVHWRNPLSSINDEFHNTVVFRKSREIVVQLKDYWLVEGSAPKTIILKGEGRNGSELPSRR